MTLAEAHTENVKRAWAARMYERNDFINRSGQSRKEYADNFASKSWVFEGNPLPLSEVLSLLAWVASQPNPPVYVSMGTFLDGDEFCTTINLHDTQPVYHDPGDLWWQNPMMQAIGTEELTEHIQLAISAIVERYPEVLGDG